MYKSSKTKIPRDFSPIDESDSSTFTVMSSLREPDGRETRSLEECELDLLPKNLRASQKMYGPRGLLLTQNQDNKTSDVYKIPLKSLGRCYSHRMVLQGDKRYDIFSNRIDDDHDYMRNLYKKARKRRPGLWSTR